MESCVFYTQPLHVMMIVINYINVYSYALNFSICDILREEKQLKKHVATVLGVQRVSTLKLTNRSKCLSTVNLIKIGNGCGWRSIWNHY